MEGQDVRLHRFRLQDLRVGNQDEVAADAPVLQGLIVVRGAIGVTAVRQMHHVAVLQALATIRAPPCLAHILL